MLLDNNPHSADFPKRSRCYIASTNLSRANNYGSSSRVLIPFDGVKIGVVNNPDMWDAKIKIFGETSNIEGLNNAWENLGIPASIDAFEQFEKLLDKKNNLAIARFKIWFPDGDPKNFMQQVFNAYSPESTGFTVHTTADLPQNIKNRSIEVWIGGKVLVISFAMWHNMYKELNFKFLKNSAT